jgi:simple sugar transport system substrate-binding protein/basic membrane protein A
VKRILFISLAVVLALGVGLIGCEGEPEPEPVLTIGAIYVGSIDDAGYNQALHDSIAVIGDNIDDVEIIEAENVPEDACTVPMQLMIDQGADLIFATSYGYHDAALALSVANPDVVFEWCGGGSENATANFGTFFGEPPNGWYMMGMAAGLMMQENEVEDPMFGFVAAFPIGWTRTFINAFTLGAQSVYPPVVPNATAAVEVVVAYTFSWSDLAQQAITTNALIDQGADVITMHVDAPTTVIGTAETRGVYSIGYQSVEAKKFASLKWIGGIGFTFGDKLTEVAQDVIDGTYVGANKYWGWDEGAMALAEWGPDVTEDIKAEVLAAKDDLEAGTLYPFTGPIYDRDTGLIAAIPKPPVSETPWVWLTENVTIPEYMLGWGDNFYAWGVTGGF